MKNIYVILADGFEEMEFIISVDVLKRADLNVVTVSLKTTRDAVLGAHNIQIIPDITLNDFDIKTCDMLLLPGGMGGTLSMAKNEKLLNIIKELNKEKKYLAAICAAPHVFVKAQVAQNKKMTSHPATTDMMEGVNYKTDRVVIDDNFITSRGPGTTFEFALAIVELFINKEKAEELKKTMLV